MHLEDEPQYTNYLCTGQFILLLLTLALSQFWANVLLLIFTLLYIIMVLWYEPVSLL